VRVPGLLFPRDGIIDPGSPFTWVPQEIWRHLQPGVDFEELPFEAGYTPPRGQTAGWNFTFRFARLLQPLTLYDPSIELERHGVIVQLANGNPPVPPGSQRPAVVVIGLWGGLLEGTSLRFGADPTSGQLAGTLEW
jgi:hypothetical protein